MSDAELFFRFLGSFGLRVFMWTISIFSSIAFLYDGRVGWGMFSIGLVVCWSYKLGRYGTRNDADGPVVARLPREEV